jgi:hypothetical protein
MGRLVRRTVLAAAVLAVAGTAPSMAADRALPSQARDHGDFITLSGNSADKAGLIRRVEVAKGNSSPGVPARSTGARAAIHGSSHLTDYTSKTVMCSYIYAKFDDTVSHPFLETSATINGSSRTAWLGACPVNAGSVHLNDTVCFDAIGISVTVGGAGFSDGGSGDCGSWNATVGSTWYINHSYTGVHGSGSLLAPIYRVRQSSSGTYKFGSSFYTVVANDSMLI